jgi:hypothetical protein
MWSDLAATQPLLRFLPACSVILYDHREERRCDGMPAYKYSWHHQTDVSILYGYHPFITSTHQPYNQQHIITTWQTTYNTWTTSHHVCWLITW